MDDDPFKPKSYGSIKIGGRKNIVQLGDSQTTNTYNVGSVNLPLPEEVLVFLADAVAKTARSSARSRGQVNGQRRLKSVLLNKKKLIVKKKRCCPSNDQEEPAAVATSDKQHVLRTLLEIINKWTGGLPMSTIPFSLASSTRSDHCAVSDEHHTETYLNECSRALVETHTERAVVVRDHSMMGAVLVSWMFGKNVTAQDLFGFLHKCSQDDLLPVLLLVLCAGVYRYYTTCTIPRSPCQLFWTLEDAYGFPRQLSMDLLVDFTVLQKFLHVHYREAKRSTGAHLIRVGQFHLMLGSRRGLVMGSTNWSEVSAAIKPGRRVINAVYVTSHDQTCLNCKAVLTVTDSGEFHCETCGTFHRDYSTFNLPTKESHSYRSSSPSLVPEPPATNLPPPTTPTIERDTNGEPGRPPPPVEVRHDYENIKNLDLRIIPRLPLHHDRSTIEEVLAVYPCHRLLTGVDLTNSIILHFYIRLQRFKRSSDEDGLLLSELPLQYGGTTTVRNADGQTSLKIPFLPHVSAIERLADMLGLKTDLDRDDGLMHLLVTHKSRGQDDSDPIDTGQPSDPGMRRREQIYRSWGPDVLWHALAATNQAELLDMLRNNRRYRYLSPAGKSLLSQALAAANQAVLLDNAQNISGAIDAYRKACDLLEQAETWIPRVEDRKKIDTICHGYYERISELLTFDSLVDGHTDRSLSLESHQLGALAETQSSVSLSKPAGHNSGTVKWFNESKGFGFIQPDNGGEALFVHHSHIGVNGFRTLSQDQRVSFEIGVGPKGMQATSVQPL